jgi:type II secretory pathway component GspD/PulD (secretin)
MLMVNATATQLKEINELIRRADVPPFQVVIKGLVYTANEDKLKDIGLQTTITGTGTKGTSGGIFGHTLGSLGTLFDFSTIIGTFDFNIQASVLQRDGVISIKSRPFATVLDGDTTDLTVGRQVPVLIQAINPIGGAPGTLQILQAANLLSVTPHVIDDDQGNPTAVNLELQLESNDVDTSVASQGVPAISVRSIQSNFILNMEQTAILGGFTVDSDSKTIQKTPGLGDIPILGELFKRRVRAAQINRLYFAVSVTVIPYGGIIEPVRVPGATTDPPSLTPELKKRSDAAEPKQVLK